MAETDFQVWSNMLGYLRQNHPAACRQWFEELEPLGIASGTLQLRSKSNIHRDYLRRECATPFNDAVRSVTGRLIMIRFLGPDDEALVPQPAKPRATPLIPGGGGVALVGSGNGSGAGSGLGSTSGVPHANAGLNGHAPTESNGFATEIEIKTPLEVAMPPDPKPPLNPPGLHAHTVNGTGHGGGAGNGVATRPNYGRAEDRGRPANRVEAPKRYESLVVNPDYCFENFVVGPGNRMAHAAALAISSNPGRAYNPFFVHGGIGLGKTHLLQAVCLRIAENNPSAVMYYTSCEGFVTQFFESVQNGEMSDFRHRFRDVDVLVIDDIHFLAKRESSQEEFFHTFNALFQANKQLILSSDAAPEDIPTLEERLVSRFKWGLVAKVDAPVFETRVAILKTKAQIRGLTLSDDVACFIAGKVNNNIRELEGAVVKLHIQSTMESRPVDMQMARESLGDSGSQPKGEPTLQAIISAVTEFYGVRLTDLQSKGRQRSIALPRQVCMFLARRCTRHSLEEIGGFFGGRDHTTVMHAVETVENRTKADPDFDLVIRSLEDRVRAPKSS